MILNINQYRKIHLQGLRTFSEQNPHTNMFDVCQTYAMISNMPLIGVLYFWMENFGIDRKIIKKIMRLKKFYGITGVRRRAV